MSIARLKALTGAAYGFLFAFQLLMLIGLGSYPVAALIIGLVAAVFISRWVVRWPLGFFLLNPLLIHTCVWGPALSLLKGDFTDVRLLLLGVRALIDVSLLLIVAWVLLRKRDIPVTLIKWGFTAIATITLYFAAADTLTSPGALLQLFTSLTYWIRLLVDVVPPLCMTMFLWRYAWTPAPRKAQERLKSLDYMAQGDTAARIASTSSQRIRNIEID